MILLASFCYSHKLKAINQSINRAPPPAQITLKTVLTRAGGRVGDEITFNADLQNCTHLLKASDRVVVFLIGKIKDFSF